MRRTLTATCHDLRTKATNVRWRLRLGREAKMRVRDSESGSRRDAFESQHPRIEIVEKRIFQSSRDASPA